MHASSFDDLIPAAKRAGFVATFLAAGITAMFGWELGAGIVEKFLIAGLMALCTFVVGYSLVFAHKAFERGMTNVGYGCCLLFGVSVFCEFVAHTSFNASNKDATIQSANFQTINFEDKRKAVTEAEAKLERIRAERAALDPMEGVANIKPWRDPASARAAVQSAEAHRLFRISEGCTVTKGPQTRAHCDMLNNARAEVERWELIAKKAIEIGAAEQELADARKSASLQHAGHAAGASQNKVLASTATGNMVPSEEAQYWTGVGLSALLAIFAICAGGILNWVAFAFEATAKPVRRAMTQVRADLEEVMGTTNMVVVDGRDELARRLAELIRGAASDLKGQAA